MPGVERAILAGTYVPGKSSRSEAEESISELAELAGTAGAVVVGKFIQKISGTNPAYFIGKGKAEEIKAEVEKEGIDLVIFDENLSPAQEKNLEELLDTKIIDRTGLILDIFAQRARTREGKLQVELAQLNYILPRLVGKGVSLSRLGGGIGTRGPGESKLESDRRRVRERISRIKHDLEKVRKTRELHRQNRRSVPFPIIAIIGYTNAGKSTLFNRLSKAPPGRGVLAEDKLFATLDPTIRKITLPKSHTALISDTVGFIKKLPHQLVESFKATLEEVQNADILLHVIDAGHPNAELQIKSVNKVLEEINVSEKPVINVFNKIDRLEDGMASHHLKLIAPESVAVSALTGEGIDALIMSLYKAISVFYPVIANAKTV